MVWAFVCASVLCCSTMLLWLVVACCCCPDLSIALQDQLPQTAASCQTHLGHACVITALPDLLHRVGLAFVPCRLTAEAHICQGHYAAEPPAFTYSSCYRATDSLSLCGTMHGVVHGLLASQGLFGKTSLSNQPTEGGVTVVCARGCYCRCIRSEAYCLAVLLFITILLCQSVRPCRLLVFPRPHSSIHPHWICPATLWQCLACTCCPVRAASEGQSGGSNGCLWVLPTTGLLRLLVLLRQQVAVFNHIMACLLYERRFNHYYWNAPGTRVLRCTRHLLCTFV